MVMLIGIPSLVTLILENTAVTDAGVKLYASFVPPLLENLDLSRTNVTQQIFQSLRGIPFLSSSLSAVFILHLFCLFAIEFWRCYCIHSDIVSS